MAQGGARRGRRSRSAARRDVSRRSLGGFGVLGVFSGQADPICVNREPSFSSREWRDHRILGVSGVSEVLARGLAIAVAPATWPVNAPTAAASLRTERPWCKDLLQPTVVRILVRACVRARENPETHEHYAVCLRCDADRDTRRPSWSPDSEDTGRGKILGLP